MRIEDSKGNQLTCLDDWRGLQVPDKWKPGRSAHSIADFVVNRQGASSLRDRVSSVLGEPVEFLKLVPEYEVRFDRYGRGRVHDLGIFGDTVSGQSLFVGVEAKVDERFNEYIGDAWREANQERDRGKGTHKPERIQELCTRFRNGPGITENSEIRYQLLYGAAGTVDAGADVSVFYVAVFMTDDYDPAVGEANYRDYLRFVECAGGEPIGTDEIGASSHRLTVGHRPLVSIYEYFDALDLATAVEGDRE